MLKKIYLVLFYLLLFFKNQYLIETNSALNQIADKLTENCQLPLYIAELNKSINKLILGVITPAIIYIIFQSINTYINHQKWQIKQQQFGNEKKTEWEKSVLYNAASAVRTTARKPSGKKHK